MADASTHPTAADLAALGRGKLPDAEVVAIASHLRTCASCQNRAQRLGAGAFVEKVRIVKAGDSSVPPATATGSPTTPFRGAENQAEATPSVPSELSQQTKYRIVRELGRGGMGVVYQAVQTLMDRMVAIKVINPSVLAHADALPRFQAEVKAAARLDHPNIVRAYDADQAGELHLLIMEFVEGTNLADRVNRKGPFPIPHACHYLRQAALGLQHAFERGMVHRDIKPGNLMRNNKGVIKILDFGLARLRSEKTQSGGITQVNAFMGTPEYVSPEQATDARNVDTRSDIYSLGCTLYYLLAGRPPFQEDTVVKQVIAQIEKEPPPLHSLRQDVPPELSAVAARMLAKDPAQRFQTPADVAQALVPFIRPGSQPVPEGARAPTQGLASPGTGTAMAGGIAETKSIRQATTPRKVARESEAPEPVAQGPEQTAAKIFVPRRGRDEAMRSRRLKLAALAWTGAILVLVLGVILFAGVALLRTGQVTLVIEVNQPNPDIFVDGDRVPVMWGDDGKKAEISLAPGTKKLEIKKDGFSVLGRDLRLNAGERQVLTVTLWPLPPPIQRAPTRASGSPSTSPSAAAASGPPSATARRSAGSLVPPARSENPLPASEEVAAGSVTTPPSPPELPHGRRNRRNPLGTGAPTSPAGDSQPGPQTDLALLPQIDSDCPPVGNWQVMGSELAQMDASGQALILFGNPLWSDYDFSVQFCRMLGNTAVTIQCRCANESNRVMLTLGAPDNTAWIIIRKDGINHNWQWRAHSIMNGVWYTVLVKVRNTHFNFFIDGKKLPFNDIRLIGLGKGKVGLGSQTCICKFRHIRVTDSFGRVLYPGLPAREGTAARKP